MCQSIGLDANGLAVAKPSFIMTFIRLWVDLPRLGGKVRKNKRAATLVHDQIRFHGTELSVDVHHAYPSRLLKSKISIAAGR